MESFWQEFKASFELGTILIGIFWSAVITTLFNYVLKAFGHQPTRKVMFWATSFLLIFVSLLVVRHAEGGSVTTQLDTIIIGNPAAKDDKYIPDQTPLLAIISARNTGKPTILENWVLEIKWQDGTTANLSPVIFPKSVTATANSGRVMDFSRD